MCPATATDLFLLVLVVVESVGAAFWRMRLSSAILRDNCYQVFAAARASYCIALRQRGNGVARRTLTASGDGGGDVRDWESSSACTLAIRVRLIAGRQNAILGRGRPE